MAKQKETGARITLQILQAALARQYPRPDSKLPDMDEQALLELLTRIQVMDLEPKPILSYIASEHPKARPGQDAYGILAFMDNSLATLLQQIKLEPQTQPPIYNVMAGLMRSTLVEGLAKVSRGHGVLSVLDSLIALSIGWDEKLGKSSTEILEHLKTTASALSMVSDSKISDAKIKESRDKYLTKLCTDTQAFAEQQQKRARRLEDRLVASETGLLKTSRARNLAAEMLNEQMRDKPLAAEIISFLQGPWFDSLQLILVREGVQSDNWFRATKLTETLLWTCGFEGLDIPDPDDQEEEEPAGPTRANFMSQIEDEELPFDGGQRVAFNVDQSPDGAIEFPGISAEGISFDADFAGDSDEYSLGGHTDDDADAAADGQSELSREEQQKLYRIVQDLPREFKPLLWSLEYQEDAKTTELDAMKAVHASIMSGSTIDKQLSDPLPCEPAILGKVAAVSQTLMDQVSALQPGQWFVFDAADEKAKHIKLLLKLDDMQQLLFTNRSGVKVLQTSFDEFAYFISSGVVTPIHPSGPFSAHLKNRLNTLVNKYLAHQKAVAEAQTKAAKKASLADKEKAKVDSAEAKAKARKLEEELKSTQIFLKAVEEKAATAGDQAAQADAEKRVSALLVGAWLRIPGPKQKPTDCKLGVKLQAADKYIFVDRRGVKVGEFKHKQLAAMVITGDCEILDSGTEFEDTLEKVVSGLREHRSLEDEND